MAGEVTLAVGERVAGVLGQGDSKLIYRLVIAERATYAFFTTGTTDTRGTLVDAAQRWIISDENAGTGSNFWFTRTLDAGTYYLTVDKPSQGAPGGEFLLHVEGPGAGTSSDDHGHSPWSATGVPLGGITEGMLSGGDDQDFFRIEVTQRATYSFFSRGSTDVQGTLYDAHYRWLMSDNDAGEARNFWFTRTLDPGTYYVAVDGPSQGAPGGRYEVHVEGPGAGSASDDHGHSPWSASAIRVGSATSGVLSGGDDQDFFKIVVTQRATYSFFSLGATDVQGSLYDGDYRWLMSDNDAGEARNFWFTRTLEPGTYYVAVDGPSQGAPGGRYEVHVEGPGAGSAGDDHGHSPWSATAMRVGTATPGVLSGGDDQDFFKITVDQRATYSFFSRGSTDVQGSLYDADYRWLTSDSDTGESSNFWFTRTLEPGTYYVATEGPSQGAPGGGYTLHVEGPGAPTISDDHGHSPWSATAMHLGSATTGVLSGGDDQDFFAITPATRGIHTFFSSGGTDTQGTLYDRDYRWLTADDNAGVGSNFWFSRTLEAGVTYYLAVEGPRQGAVGGSYEVRVLAGSYDPNQGANNPPPQPRPGDALPALSMPSQAWAVEMARFAGIAYLDEPFTSAPSRGGQLRDPSGELHTPPSSAQWRPVTDLQVASGSFEHGVFKDAEDRGAAHLYVARVDGVNTLVIAFRGTDSVWEDLVRDLAPDAATATRLFDTHYARFEPLIDALPAYFDRYGIQSVQVTGHSLGGAMTQLFMDDFADGAGRSFRALTIGSPGAAYGSQPRIVHVAHTLDGVATLLSDRLGANRLPIDIVDASPQEGSEHRAERYATSLDLLARTEWAPSPTNGTRAFQEVDLYAGTSGRDVHLASAANNRSVIGGRDGPDTLMGAGGNERFIGGQGDDTIDGAGGTDTAYYLGRFREHRITVHSDRVVISGPEGTDTLYRVERLKFADGDRALDTDGHAGSVARVIGAVFGASAIRIGEYVGVGLSLLDGGMSVEDLAHMAIDVGLGTGAAVERVVERLYSNVVGSFPSASEVASYADLVRNGTYTLGQLGWLAANSALNAANIDLVGLAADGLPFVPFGD